jgi:hypothetical protein
VLGPSGRRTVRGLAQADPHCHRCGGNGTEGGLSSDQASVLPGGGTLGQGDGVTASEDAAVGVAMKVPPHETPTITRWSLMPDGNVEPQPG